MSQKLENYRKGNHPLPAEQLAWQIFGAGFENVGRDGKPTRCPLREPNDDEIMCRIDAVGLCLSDIKIINQGSNHPRLRGRDLASDPTVLGHECCVTVMKTGARWRDKFAKGDRFIVQADIYYKGLGYAFGYLIPGGLQQYCYLDERVLAGDEGCYLLPVQPDTGYSQSALSEPWACVEMSYNLENHFEPGKTLVVTNEPPEWLGRFPEADVVPDIETQFPDKTYDAIMVTNPKPSTVEKLAAHLNKNGIMYLIGSPAEKGFASLDIGRIHYENIRFLGGGDNPESVQKANARHDLLPQGVALFIGAGGPMGQMHVQRAIEIPCGSRRVVVTDLDPSRLEHIRNRFGGLAKRKGVELFTLCPKDFASQDEMNKRIQELAPNGYTDICVLAPVPALVTQAMEWAGDNALVNVFAGIPIGTPAKIRVEDLCRGIKIVGSSGSRIRDLQKILSMVEAGHLNTDLSVAAIGGLNTAREGLEAVKNGRFPGKIVIYPQLPELPLMALEEIPQHIPEIADKLGTNGEWTKQAEEALLELYL